MSKLSWERNTEGIKADAQRKREEAIAKTENAIKQMIKDQKPINFETVATTAGVSRAWLYKQDDLRSRIETLRSQQSGKKSIPQNQRASDASKNALMKTYKERTKKLEAENRELREQVEVAYGLAHAEVVPELEREIRDLTKENQRLMRLLTQAREEIEWMKIKVQGGQDSF